MRGVNRQREGLGEPEENTFASRLRRLPVPSAGGSRALETTEVADLGRETRPGTKRGEREVRIGTSVNLHRLQVHRKWEMSDIMM